MGTEPSKPPTTAPRYSLSIPNIVLPADLGGDGVIAIHAGGCWELVNVRHLRGPKFLMKQQNDLQLVENTPV